MVHFSREVSDSGELSTPRTKQINHTADEVGNEMEPTMAQNKENKRQLSTAPGDSPSTLLPMLISGLVLIIIGMIAVAAFT
jgi:hypothetical protein